MSGWRSQPGQAMGASEGMVGNVSFIPRSLRPVKDLKIFVQSSPWTAGEGRQSS